MLRFRRVTVALVVLMTVWPTLVFGQAPTKAGIVTTLEGRATATRVVLPQPVALTFKDDVFLNDEITTAEKSLARILLGGKAVVTVRERSSLTITEVPGMSTIDLASGKIAVSVARERMRPGERIQIRTPNAITGIRGTSLIVDVIRSIEDIRQPDPNVLTRLGVFEGDVDVLHIHPVTKAPLAPPVNVAVNTKFTATGARPAAVGPFQPGDAQSFQAGLTPSAPQHVQAANEPQLAFQAQETADTLILTLLGGTGALVAPPVNISPPTTPTVDPELNEQRAITTLTPTGPPPPPSPSIPPGIVIDPALQPFVDAPAVVLVPSGSGSITTAGNAVEVDASAPTTAALSIPLLTVADGDLTVAGHLLNVVGSFSSTTTSPVIGLDPTTVTTTGDLVRVGPGGTLTVAGTLVNDEGGTLMLRSQGVLPSSLLRVDGGRVTNTGTDALLMAEQSRITTSGDVVSLTGGSTLTTPGTLVLATGGTLSPASGTVLSLSDGSSLTTGRVLDLTDIDLALTGPVVSMTDGSSLTTTMDSAIRITGGSLTADSLIATDNSNVINVTGTVLDMTDTAVRLNLLGRLEEPVTFNRGANEPLIRMLRSTLTHLSEDAALLDFGNDSGIPITLGGVGLVAAGTPGPTPQRSVLDVNSLMALGGVNLTDTAPQIQLTLTDVNANGVGSLIQVFGSPVTARGPLLAADGANFNLASSLLFLGGGSLTVNNPLPGDQPALLQFTDSNIGTAGAGLVVASSGNTLTLDRGLLDANNSTLVTRDGAVVAVQGGASVTTTGTNAPLLRFAGTAVGSSRVSVDDNVVSLAALTPGGAAPSMSLSGPLLESTLTTVVNGDPATNPRSVLFVGDGATLTSTSADPLVSLLDRTSLTTTGGMLSVRRSGDDPSTMTLAGSLLRAQDSSITAFATGLRDTAGAQRLCCSLLSVGQGAELTSTSTAPLIDLTGTTVSLGSRFVVVFDTTSIFGEPTITGPGSVSLAGPLARAGGGSIAGLEDFLGIFRSSLDSSTAAPLIQLDGTPVTMGGISPINGAPLPGRLLNISGSATTPATLTLAGPLFSANNSVIRTTDDLFGVFGGARVTSTTPEPLLSITGGSATGAVNGSFFIMTAAAGVPPPVVSLEGGLLRARGTTLVNGDPEESTPAFMFVGEGASLSSTSPDALFDFARTTVRTGTLLSVRRPRATPSMIDLDGPFLIATDSSINTTATALRNNANQPILCCNVLSVGQGARFNSDSIDPLIDLARTRVITGDRLVSVFDATSLAGETPLPPTRSFLTLDGSLVRSVGGGIGGITTVQDLVGIFRSSVTSTTVDPLIAVDGTPLSLGGISPLDGSATAGRVLHMQGSPTLPAMLDLRGPFFDANNAVITTTADGFSFFNGSHGISTTPNPFIAIAGGSFTTGPNGTFLGLASNEGQASSSLSLQGPLLSATGTTLRNGGPGQNVPFLFVGDSATLTSTTAQPLLAFDTTTVDSTSNMLTLRRSRSAEAPSTVSLRGPLLTGTASRFNTSTFSGFFVAEGARLLSTTSLPLIRLVGSTFNTAPGEETGFDFFSLTDTSGEETALPASVSLAGPFLGANGSQINAQSNLLGVTRSSFTSTSTQPLLQLNNTTVNVGNSVTRVVDGQLLASTVSALASLVNNSRVTSGSHAVDVTGETANVELRDLVRLTNSIMTVNSGHLVNLSASRLNVNGNLVTLAGNSTLNILNGLLLNMTGGTATIEGALVRFTGANNTVNVTNSIRPNFFRSGIPMFVGPGTPTPLVFGTPVVGTGAININGVPLSPSATGSLIAVQGGARLQIGRALPD